MKFVSVSKEEGIATVTLSRGKVNALNERFIEELQDCFNTLEKEEAVKAVLLTGRGKFFSFGFDIPEFLTYSRESFRRYLNKFTDFYTYLFLYPKPVIAAINGHAIAGGCMLANSCDYRLMVSGKAKISLNEITFGASVFSGSVEILKYCAGQRNAQKILFSGDMYAAEEALQLGLIDQISSTENIVEDAFKTAQDFAAKESWTFRSLKNLLRKPVTDEMIKREKDSIKEFIDIWYSERIWKNLEKIKIHS
jgi:enoyl-CoA hydratase/carnithine racemase